MGYEVDVIGIGKESKSGDAIAVRWGNLYGARDEQRVVLIDGGFKKSGQDVAAHIGKHYDTDVIDAVISTHPDQDHIGGLAEVLSTFQVNQLWIHLPWKHDDTLKSLKESGRISDATLKETVDAAAELVSGAQERGIRIVEPFQGVNLYQERQLTVLGPTLEYYEELVRQFDGMPASNDTIRLRLEELLKEGRRKMRQFCSVWGVDEINDSDNTSATNRSSVITQLCVDGHQLLFTADAGVTALSHAASLVEDTAEYCPLRFVQIPHHGSRRNVGPTVLNRLVGPPVSKEETRDIVAIASTAEKGEPKHPRKAVLNAFIHRGVTTMATRGSTILYNHDAPERRDWDDAVPESYHWVYEDEE